MFYSTVMFLKSQVFSTLFCLISSVTPQPALRSHSLNKVLRALQSGPLAPYCHILSLLPLKLYCSYMKHLPGRSKCQDCSPVQDFTPVFCYWSKLVLTLGNCLLALLSMRKWTLSIHCVLLALSTMHTTQ